MIFNSVWDKTLATHLPQTHTHTQSCSTSYTVEHKGKFGGLRGPEKGMW